MSAKAFFDSNVLLYLVSAERAKADRAQALLNAGGVVSVQVLNEMLLVCRRKLGATWEQCDTLLALVREKCHVETMTTETHDLGRRLAEKYQTQIYDAMIVASALLAEVDVLYTEDMQHGLKIDKRLTLRNPFRA